MIDMQPTIKELKIAQKHYKQATERFEKIDTKCDKARKEYVYCIQESYKINPKTYINAEKHYEKTAAEQRKAYDELMKAYNEYMALIDKVEVD